MLPPSPSHILRIHSAHVNVVAFSSDNERLYSGDLAGHIVVTSTRTLRSITAWKPHNDGILGVQEWADNIVTHGRDNKLHIWTRVLAQETVGDVASRVDLPVPTLRYSLDVNALNFCRFSLLDLPESNALPNTSSASAAARNSALIALPNLIESSLADIWELPSCSRQHAAIGKLEAPEIGMSSWELDNNGRGRAKTGILMALHLFMRSDQLHLLSAYESGEVALRMYSCEGQTSIEGRGWECIWKVKLHNESVMAMSVSRDHRFALTVSADHIIARYILDAEDVDEKFSRFKTKQPGNASIVIRGDGRICAVGGWDGKIRLFSTKSFKPLGTLTYHTKSCQALSFANANVVDNNYEDDELTPGEREARTRWLVAGSQDNRLTIWELMDFIKPVQGQSDS